VGRPGFKPGGWRQASPGGFDSRAPPPVSSGDQIQIERDARPHRRRTEQSFGIEVEPEPSIQAPLSPTRLSNSFKPTSDCLSNLVRTVLLHKMKAFNDNMVLVREVFRQLSHSPRDEHTGVRVDKKLR
jgi:hypothetical protein